MTLNVLLPFQTQTFLRFCAFTVGALALAFDSDDTTCCFSRSDTGFVSFATGPPSGAQFRGKLDALPQVDVVRISDDTRLDVRHIVPSACVHVLTHTLCIHPSESISLGLPRRHHQVWGKEEFQ